MTDPSKRSVRKGGKLAPNGPPFIPPEIIPDRLKVPDNTILLVPDTPLYVDPPHFTKAGQHRDWFDSYFYHCLPLVMGNQHGFLMLATYDFVCRWNGSNDIDGVSIHALEPVPEPNYLTLESHFGHGILTIQSRYVFRTPKGVNLMVKEPPNYPIHGISWMNAIVETDNLRRDFTFNLKITQPHMDIYIPRNTPVGCLLPYPRYFLDDYSMSELKDEDELRKSERTINYFAKERDDFDLSPRHRYMEGVDIYNIEFKHHQKTLDHGKWWFSSERKKNIPSQPFDAQEEPESNNSLLGSVVKIFKRFFVLTNALATNGGNTAEQAGKCPLSKAAISTADSMPLHGKKIVPTGKEESTTPTQSLESNRTMSANDEKMSAETAKCPVKHNENPAASAAAEENKATETAKCPVKHNESSTAPVATEENKVAETAKCPVMHNAGSSGFGSAASRSEWALDPKNFPEIMELNADLPEATITLYLPPNYDKSLAPVKAERLRAWFEQDNKTKDHARFCLPLTMGGGIGWFILSPATFTISWDGDPTHDAEVEIIDACSHADVDCHSAHGSFTVQSQFVPRTKRPGDFVFIKGIGNQYRLPYYFLEAMLEAWWSPANFGLVAMLNQPGKFTIKKGEPIAQMFAINVEQAAYNLALREDYAPHWQEWDDKRRDPRYTGKNLDYLKGLWPDETPVSPHFKSWGAQGAAIDKAATKDPEATTSQAPEQKASKASEPTAAKSPAHTAGQAPQKAVQADAATSVYELVQKACSALMVGDQAQADHLLERATSNAIREKRVSMDVISAMYGVGTLYLQRSQFDKVISTLTQGVSLCARVEHVQHDLAARMLTDLAYAERSLGLLPAAEQHYRTALEVVMETSDNDVAIANAMFYLGSTLDQMGRLEDSEPLILEALDIHERKLGPKHPETLFIRNGLACLYTHQNRLVEAKELFDNVIPLRAEMLGKDSLQLADSYNDLGFLHLEESDWAKAQEAFKTAAEIRRSKLGEDDLGVAEFLNNVAFAYRRSKEFAEAKDYFEKVLAIKEKCLSPKDPAIAWSLKDLAHAYEDLGNKPKADQLFKRADSLS